MLSGGFSVAIRMTHRLRGRASAWAWRHTIWGGTTMHGRSSRESSMGAIRRGLFMRDCWPWGTCVTNAANGNKPNTILISI